MSYDEAMAQLGFQREQELAVQARADRDRFAWKLTMLFLPWFSLLAVTVYWIGIISNRTAVPYRTVLTTVFGERWVAQSVGGRATAPGSWWRSVWRYWRWWSG